MNNQEHLELLAAKAKLKLKEITALLDKLETDIARNSNSITAHANLIINIQNDIKIYLDTIKLVAKDNV